MHRRSFLAAAAATVAMPFVVRAAEAPSPADLRGDIAILRRAMTLHPGLYRYLSPRGWEAALASFERDWLAAPGIDGRYLALSRLTAKIRCGHSHASFFNQRRAVAAELFDRPTRLPFHFVWIDGRMIVTRDTSGLDRLLPGAEIVRVNGMAPRALLAAFMPYTRADGSNDDKRVSLLEAAGRDSVEYFDVLQGLLFPPEGGVHRVEAVLPGGLRRTFDLPAIGLAARQSAMTNRTRDPAAPMWDWAMRPDGIAVLTMPGWAMYNSKWDWRSWLDDRLDSLGGAKGLIVDLRDNEGGNDCGDPILARLIDRDLVPPGYEQRLRFERTPPEIDRYLDTWDDSFRTMGVGGAPLPDGFVARPGVAADTTIRAVPPGKRLTLPVSVLTSPVNSSATFQFAVNARLTGAVKLVGRTTGGNRRGINGGAYFFVRLPASGLEFDLPLVGYYARAPQPDAGVVPDVSIAMTTGDIAAGRDATMARAVAGYRP